MPSAAAVAGAFGPFELLAADFFPGANGALVAPWSNAAGEPATFQRVSNIATVSNLSLTTAYQYTLPGQTCPADQFSAVVLSGPTSTSQAGYGAAVRCNATANTFYYFVVNTSGILVAKLVAGAGAALFTSSSVTGATGDMFLIAVQGTQIVVYKITAAGAWSVICSVVDGDIATGVFGMAYRAADTGGGIKAWYGGRATSLVAMGGGGGGAGVFDFYISASGSDSNAGTLTAPWAITAINSKQATYSGKRVGVIGPATINVGSLMNTNQDPPALNINGGTSAASTYLAPCDASGNYAPRTVTITANNGNYGGGNANNCAMIGQGLGAPNAGYVTLDGFVLSGASIFCVLWGNHDNTNASSPGLITQNNEVTGNSAANSTAASGVNCCPLQLFNGVGAQFLNNYVHDNAGGYPTFDTDGSHFSAAYVWQSQGTIFDTNTVVNSGGLHGKEGGNQGTTIRSNYIDWSAGPLGQNGSCIQGFDGATTGGLTQTTSIHHNILIGNEEFMDLEAELNNGGYTTACLIYNNTMIATGSGMANDGVRWFEQTAGSKLLSFYNNLFFDAGGAAPAQYGYVIANADAFALADYNLYGTSSPKWTTVTNGGHSSGGASTVTTLAAWKSAIGGLEAHSAQGIATFNDTGSFALNYGTTGGPAYQTGKVGGVSSGATCNIGAFDGTVTQIGCNFTPNPPTTGTPASDLFPRNFALVQGGQSSYPNSTFKTIAAKYNFVEMNPYLGIESDIGVTMASICAALESAGNSNGILCRPSFYTIDEANAATFNNWTTQLGNANWFLRTSYPGGGTIPSYNGVGLACNNCSANSVLDSGSRTFFQAFARYFWNVLTQGNAVSLFGEAKGFAVNPSLACLFIDNRFWIPRYNGDWDLNGSSDSGSSLTQQQGHKSTCDAYRALSSLLLIGNADQFNNYIPGGGSNPTIETASVNLYDVVFCEEFIGQTYSKEDRTDSVSALQALMYCEAMIASGGTLVLHQDNASGSDSWPTSQGSWNAADWQAGRYGGTAALMRGYHYAPSCSNYSAANILYFDEFQQGGIVPWLGSAIEPPQTAARSNGVWWRDFQGGRALWAPKGTGSVSIALGKTMHRCNTNGFGDPTINSGAAITSWAPNGGRDGIVLRN